MKDITYKHILACVAHGHAFTKHVLGDDPLSKYNNEKQFRHCGLGPDLKIDSIETFEQYLNEFFLRENTRGFIDPQATHMYYFYNKKDNVLVVLDAHSDDFGSSYRPEPKIWKGQASGAQFFREKFDKAKRYVENTRHPKINPIRFVSAKGPEALEKLLKKFVKEAQRRNGAEFRRRIKGLPRNWEPPETAHIKAKEPVDPDLFLSENEQAEDILDILKNEDTVPFHAKVNDQKSLCFHDEVTDEIVIIGSGDPVLYTLDEFFDLDLKEIDGLDDKQKTATVISEDLSLNAHFSPAVTNALVKRTDIELEAPIGVPLTLEKP